MKKQLFVIATGLSLGASALLAQGGDLQLSTFQFQAASTMGGGNIVMNPLGARGGLVTGSPMSAREVNKTVQTLSDGTEIETSHTTMFYRDSVGRTRTEPQEPNGTVMITDPVAAVRIMLSPSSKSATRTNAPALAAGRGVAYNVTTSGGVTTSTVSPAEADAIKVQLNAVQEKLAAEIEAQRALGMAAGRVAAQPKNQANTEDLGFQMQNGVMAQGTRSTLTIPQGQIGNSRDIHVVNERWYSKDLQMVVKSVNSDPRFGVTTFDLQNLSQNAPDPTLFQIPTGYTINEGGARGAVGVRK